MIPHVVVLSSLFPSARQPGSGLFVRERAFRLGQRTSLAVVAPTPWFPAQAALHYWRPGLRPGAPGYESQRGFDVWYPRFLSAPGLLKRCDGISMALAAYPRMKTLKAQGRLDVIDSHFGYPDGRAAGLLARWLGVPYTVTLRGTEVRHAADPVLAPQLGQALRSADRVFSVSDSLRRVALSLDVAPERARVVGNGVDISRFYPLDRTEQRRALGLPDDAPVLVTVGGLCERKGFHRVMACLPELRQAWPDLRYLVIGGPSPEGDWTTRLKSLARELALQDCVHFTGPLPPEDVGRYLSAADVFVLATRNEGWANVLLEAMACGLPVVATDVGGNAEVVCRPELGTVVPFGDATALARALRKSLQYDWNRSEIRRYAEANVWDRRIDELEAEFIDLASRPRSPAQLRTMY
ncbi:MAG: glycosyl transferase family 1 [Leptothrix sp. (in: Bacteria)]|nr:glycosyl transferase family 1 [Leptothrix sp. (in: b-proteobacteria)]